MKIGSRRIATAMLLAVGLLVLPVISAEQNGKQSDTLDDLLKQRRDTLQQLVKVVKEQYHQGTSDYAAVAKSTDQLIDAELELADNHQERIALLKRRVDLMESLEALTEGQFLSGQRAPSEPLQARAAVLEAKIELARERDKGN